MAYGIKYYIQFKNRFQNDIYKINILEKDFVGSSTELTGAENPFTAAYTNSDTDILTPIKPLELTISFNTDGSISIDDFYSDDDEKFRVDYYFESFADGTGTEKLLYSAYLVEDGVNEPIKDFNHVITLKATDNLALLKQFKYNEVAYFDPFPLIQKQLLQLIVEFILNKTNLYNLDQVIDKSLPLRIFDNLFENTTDDRSVSSIKDPFLQTALFTGMFQNGDGTWQDCYTVLETILKSKNACIFQADGFWNIMRIPEYFLFTDGAIKGTQYNFNGTSTDVTAVTLAPLVSIERNGTQLQPINEDQTKSTQRPLKYVKNTFNYNQPASYLIHSDLQLPIGATPDSTGTTGGVRTDDYNLTTIFPEWKANDGDTSFLRVLTDVASDTETERYIVTVGTSNTHRGVIFNPIEVSKGDRLDFSFSFRTPSDEGSGFHFYVRFILILANGTYVVLNTETTPGQAYWSGPFAATVWDTASASEIFIPASTDSGQYTTWGLASKLADHNEVALFPADGVLLISVEGNNTGNVSEPHTDVYWKDINLSITNYINESVKITGQTHTDTGTSTIKAIQENDIEIDDSPRNTIAGTLFTNARTNFDFTDSTTGEATEIGDVYFTKTTLWHRASISEALRLGNIITQERLRLNYTSRAIVEGTFKNLRYDTNKFVSLLSLFEFPSDPKLSGKKFIAASITLDYLACTFNARLIEIFKDDEDDFSDSYLFKFLYKSN